MYKIAQNIKKLRKGERVLKISDTEYSKKWHLPYSSNISFWSYCALKRLDTTFNKVTAMLLNSVAPASL